MILDWFSIRYFIYCLRKIKCIDYNLIIICDKNFVQVETGLFIITKKSTSYIFVLIVSK